MTSFHRQQDRLQAREGVACQGHKERKALMELGLGQVLSRSLSRLPWWLRVIVREPILT